MIKTVGALDREVKAVYEVSVKVRDTGIPPRSSKSTVRVLVTDVNDNTPVFVEPREASVSVREDEPAGTEVLQVNCHLPFIILAYLMYLHYVVKLATSTQCLDPIISIFLKSLQYFIS